MNAIELINKEFDDLKMQGDYNEMLELVQDNEVLLIADGWDVKTLCDDLEKIIVLHNRL